MKVRLRITLKSGNCVRVYKTCADQAAAESAISAIQAEMAAAGTYWVSTGYDDLTQFTIVKDEIAAVELGGWE